MNGTRTSFVTAGGYRLHLRRIEGERPRMPTLVFLHQGLGTIAVWGDVPDVLCRATGLPGVIYERPGYGASDPRPLPWPDDVLEQEAEIVLPALLDALGIERPVLIGHSDGGTIALLFAAAFPDRACALITEGAHVFLDELTFAGVSALERSWREGDLCAQLEQLHGPATDSLFRGWSRLWLAPARRAWSITERLARIKCPVLAIQGADDEYGLPAQLDAIVDGVAGPAQRMLVPNCAHDPHDQARDPVLDRMASFVRSLKSG
jgi:pimeloyl-ACP methyl ester carboxylesterase